MSRVVIKRIDGTHYRDYILYLGDDLVALVMVTKGHRTCGLSRREDYLRLSLLRKVARNLRKAGL